MNKLKKQKLVNIINSVGATIGFFLIILGLFYLFEISINYLVFFLIFVGLILLIWKFILGRKLK